MNPQISIIIPVLNESGIINFTIEHLYTLDSSNTVEIIVVDGSPHGETINTITGSDVQKISGQKGRGSQMNQGAAVAGGDILLFLHADTRLSRDALNQIVAATKQPDVVGGAFDLGIQSEKKIFRLIEQAASIRSRLTRIPYGDQAIFFKKRFFDQIFTATKHQDIVGGAFDLSIQSEKKIYRLIEQTASIRSRLTRIPYGDQAIFLKKRFFDQIGGFKDIPIMEDVELMQRVKKAGKKIKFITRKVQTSSRRWENEGIVYCTLRNWALITLYLLGVSPDKLKKFYF